MYLTPYFVMLSGSLETITEMCLKNLPLFRRKRELYQEYFTLLETLEYNIYHTKVQKKLLDDLVDIVVGVRSYNVHTISKDKCNKESLANISTWP